MGFGAMRVPFVLSVQSVVQLFLIVSGLCKELCEIEKVTTL